MTRLIKNFNHPKSLMTDISGSFAVFATFAILALALAAGATVDYSRIARTKSSTAASLDAALLAVGNSMSNGITDQAALQAQFEAMFNVNLQGRGSQSTDYRINSFSADPDSGKVTASVEAEVEMSLMKIGGHNKKVIPIDGEAIFAQQKTEVVMVLDVTGSMRGYKLASLMSASTTASQILLPDLKSRGVRVGLVPYSASVNVGRNFAQKVLSQDILLAMQNGSLAGAGANHVNAANSDGCVTERVGRDMATDESYLVSRIGSDRRARGRCPTTEILPLTNDASEIVNSLLSMRAEGGTAGHLGIAWAYYMLSEKWADLWPAESDPEPYSSGVNKVAILMTDGGFNTSYSGLSSSRIAQALCNDMKAPKNGYKRITIYSIAFNAPASAERLLRNCATPDDSERTYYYAPQSGNQLENTFREIAQSIQTLRLSK